MCGVLEGYGKGDWHGNLKIRRKTMQGRLTERAVGPAGGDFERVFGKFPIAAFIADREGRILGVNERFEDELACPARPQAGEKIWKYVHILAEDGSRDPEEGFSWWQRLLGAMRKSPDGDSDILRLGAPGGAERLVAIELRPVLVDDGRKEWILGVVAGRDEMARLQKELEAAKASILEHNRNLERKVEENLKEIKHRNRILEELSITDELTKLYNRRFLFKRLTEEVHRADRYGTPFSIVLLDIDFFKKVNDNYGHQAGDMVLYELAGIISGSARAMDVVTRFGGEEFMVILPAVEEKNAFHFCERLRKNVYDFQFAYLPEGIHVTVSMGVADYPNARIKDTDELIHAADMALYKAKETRNRTILASSVQ